MSGQALTKDTKCRSLGFVDNPPRGYFRTVKTCHSADAKTIVATVQLNTAINNYERLTTIVYDTIIRDTCNIYNPTTGEFTVLVSGVYDIQATICATDFTTLPQELYAIQIRVTTPSSSPLAVRLFKSAHFICRCDTSPVVEPKFESESIHREIEANKGDIITIVAVFADDGGTITLRGTPEEGQTWVTVRRVT